MELSLLHGHSELADLVAGDELGEADIAQSVNLGAKSAMKVSFGMERRVFFLRPLFGGGGRVREATAVEENAGIPPERL